MNTENQYLADSNNASIHISDTYNNKILNIKIENNIFAFWKKFSYNFFVQRLISSFHCLGNFLHLGF